MAKQKGISILNSKIVVAVVLLLLFFLGYGFFQAWKAKVEMGSVDVSYAQPSPTPVQESNFVVTCPKRVTLSKEYRYQEPLNSFFGLTLKDGQGKVCEVILGPTYAASHEGFSGEQIQINSYAMAQVTSDQLMKEDRGAEISRLEGRLLYRRPSYGGYDHVLVFQTSSSLLQLIWREAATKNQLEKVVLDLATKIK